MTPAATAEAPVPNANSELLAAVHLQHMKHQRKVQRNISHLVAPVDSGPIIMSRDGKELPGFYTLAYSKVPDEDYSHVLARMTHESQEGSVFVEAFRSKKTWDIYRKI